MSKKNNNLYEKKSMYKGYFKYFFRVMLISFIPVLIIDVLLYILIGTTHEWVIWVVTAVCLTIAGVIGLYVQSLYEKAEKEENERKSKRAIPKEEDIDIFGE